MRLPCFRAPRCKGHRAGLTFEVFDQRVFGVTIGKGQGLFERANGAPVGFDRIKLQISDNNKRPKPLYKANGLKIAENLIACSKVFTEATSCTTCARPTRTTPAHVLALVCNQT